MTPCQCNVIHYTDIGIAPGVGGWFCFGEKGAGGSASSMQRSRIERDFGDFE